MRIMVAGGAGYVGAALVPKLVSRGYDVEVVDLFWFGNNLPASVPARRADIIDLTPQDLAGFDQVVFLAGLSNDPMAEFSPALNFVANAACPAYLAYLAKRAGVKRFIYASSCSVYGYTVDEFYDEDSPTVARYPYGISKLQGEQAVLGLADDAFSVIALRKGTISGYSPRMRFDLVVNTMFRTAVAEGIIRVNNPSIWRPILSMQDAVAAYVRAIEAGPEISGVFNVASGNFTVGALGDLVREGAQLHLRKSVPIDIQHAHDFRNYKVSVLRAEHVLGFSPSQGIVDIVGELADHLPEFGDFTRREYYNIETFKSLDLRPRNG